MTNARAIRSTRRSTRWSANENYLIRRALEWK
jgi:hypothetical protein